MMRQKRTAMMRKRRRTALIMFALSVLVVATCVGTVKSRHKNVEAEEDTYIEYVVQSGDTVWSIARAHNDCNVDVRIIVDEISEKNQIKDALIYCGDVLLIPTRYGGGE